MHPRMKDIAESWLPGNEPMNFSEEEEEVMLIAYKAAKECGYIVAFDYFKAGYIWGRKAGNAERREGSGR